jgi:hypothetical protein
MRKTEVDMDREHLTARQLLVRIDTIKTQATTVHNKMRLGNKAAGILEEATASLKDMALTLTDNSRPRNKRKKMSRL